MIIDAHAHAFPHFAGASGHADAPTHLAMQQRRIHTWWGRMVSSTMDERFMPLPDEDVGFRVGKFGRYYWTKNGRECWLQRFPLSMEEMEWSPERMVAHMDSVGVDVGVLQAGYMEINFCMEYFDDCVKRFPGRFVSTITTDYDSRKSDVHLQGEIRKLRTWVRDRGVRGVYQGYPKAGLPIDDERFDPFWAALSDLDVPHILLTGFEPHQRYLDSLARLERVRLKFPGVKIVIGHLGGNARHPSHPGFTDTPNELLKLLERPNTYFEVGYVLAFENREVWGRDYEYPYPRHNEIIRKVYEAVGAEKLLWGSDMPNIERSCTYLQCLDLVRLHCDFLSPREKELVLCDNAAALFRIPTTKSAIHAERNSAAR